MATIGLGVYHQTRVIQLARMLAHRITYWLLCGIHPFPNDPERYLLCGIVLSEALHRRAHGDHSLYIRLFSREEAVTGRRVDDDSCDQET